MLHLTCIQFSMPHTPCQQHATVYRVSWRCLQLIGPKTLASCNICSTCRWQFAVSQIVCVCAYFKYRANTNWRPIAQVKSQSSLGGTGRGSCTCHTVTKKKRRTSPIEFSRKYWGERLKVAWQPFVCMTVCVCVCIKSHFYRITDICMYVQ